MIYYVDIDETICEKSPNNNYNDAVPIAENIEKINSLFDQGHTIVYWTARGTGSGIDWSSVTKSQFKLWGVKYHSLNFGKPVYDYWVDDKAINSKDFFNFGC